MYVRFKKIRIAKSSTKSLICDSATIPKLLKIIDFLRSKNNFPTFINFLNKTNINHANRNSHARSFANNERRQSC